MHGRKPIALLLCLFLLAAQAPVFTESLPQVMYADWIREPFVEKDSSVSTGQTTLWTCLFFGSYPQTEIVPAPSGAVDEYAVREGDFLADPDLYEELVRADWRDSETELAGVRYLRMNREDAVTSASDREGHYRWGEGDEWHYFRFDPIRWRVIGLEDGAVCLMADQLLDCRPFDVTGGPVSWETSTVRSWLNGYPAEANSAGIDYRGRGFLDTAFSAEEREALIETKVKNPANGRYGTDCGNDTEDRVFLLSNAEVFSSDIAARNGFYAGSGYDDPAKRFRSTLYAKIRGAWWSSVDGYRGNSFWFMRTSGYNPESITYICDFGYIYQRGTIATCEDAGLLPVIRIDPDLAVTEPAGTVSSKEIMAGAAQGSAEPDPRGRDRIVNPVVRTAPGEPDWKAVTYSMVQFGSYPQTEILPEAAENRELYEVLKGTEWTGNECELNGQTFLRADLSDTDGSSSVRYFVREPLLWRVLEVRDGTALLLSHAAVECEPFQADLRDVTWESCTLRSWLNGYGPQMNASGADYSGAGENFPDLAFSAKEREAILKTRVRNEKNYYFGTDSGVATEDRIFLPAESEIFIYDSSAIHGFSRHDEVEDRARQFRPTDYAVRKGVWKDSEESGGSGNVFWITRTTGYTQTNVVYVDESGCLYNRGILVTCGDAAIIPALVLDLNSTAYAYAGTFTIGTPADGPEYP